MNLIFHDRSPAVIEPGAAVLTIERKGNFYFSAGAVKRLALAVGTLVLPAQDTDSNQWYMLLGSGPAIVNSKPFELRQVGGKSGSRLVFSSTTRARAYFEANKVPASVSSVHLRIETEPFHQDFVGKLYPLLPAEQPSPAVAVAKAVAKVPLSNTEKGSAAADIQFLLDRIRNTVYEFRGLAFAKISPTTKTRALGLLSKNEALLDSVKGATELLAALKGELTNA